MSVDKAPTSSTSNTSSSPPKKPIPSTTSTPVPTSTPSTTPPTAALPSTLLTFLALYLTTLFSLDTWSAALASPYRAPSSHATIHSRPANPPPPRDSYQGRMHGRGNHGPGSGTRGNAGSGGRGVGRLPQATDSRAPLRMGGSAACGACM
ncbi:hypothetical protein CC80DRAFT_495167, partial [Byssothecium circinans]